MNDHLHKFEYFFCPLRAVQNLKPVASFLCAIKKYIDNIYKFLNDNIKNIIICVLLTSNLYLYY